MSQVINRASTSSAPIKAIALFSGGADSMLAARLIRLQGIEVSAVYFSTCFFNKTDNDLERLHSLCRKLEIEFESVFLGDDYIRMLADPKFGYGNAFNPCIDCHVMMLQTARAMMPAKGASFIISGEVLGQRPMSQHLQALNRVERESGLRGRLLRPLSAKLLPPTFPELKRIVDRSKLLDLSGRSRKRQIELARNLGIDDLPGSGGGCALTEKAFGNRARDIFIHAPEGLPTCDDALLLRFGRHFRKHPSFKIVVGRNMSDNDRLEASAKPGDLLFTTPDRKRYVGPIALARGTIPHDDWTWIASLMLRYADVDKGAPEQVAARDHRGNLLKLVTALPMDPEQAKRHLI